MATSTTSDLLQTLGPSYFIGQVHIGAALEQTGVLNFFNSSSAFLTSFKAGNATAAVAYTWPTGAPAANNNVLAGSTAGVLSWIQSLDPTASPTFASITLTATSNQLVLGTTRTVTFTAPTPASASRTITFPDLSGDYSVVGTIGAQEITGTKTFTSSSGTGFANASAPSASTAGGLDIWSGGISIVVGADSTLTSRTNATTKFARIGCAHYTNSEEPTTFAVLSSDNTNNTVVIGGGSGLLNAATLINFNTAANQTTTDGTTRASITNTAPWVHLGADGDTTNISTRLNGPSGTGANTATLTNSPTTGNPAEWIQINVNGNTRRFPVWT